MGLDWEKANRKQTVRERGAEDARAEGWLDDQVQRIEVTPVGPRPRKGKPATAKQLAYIRRLGGTPLPTMTMKEARRMTTTLQRTRAREVQR